VNIDEGGMLRKCGEYPQGSGEERRKKGLCVAVNEKREKAMGGGVAVEMEGGFNFI